MERQLEMNGAVSTALTLFLIAALLLVVLWFDAKRSAQIRSEWLEDVEKLEEEKSEETEKAQPEVWIWDRSRYDADALPRLQRLARRQALFGLPEVWARPAYEGDSGDEDTQGRVIG